MDTRWDVGGVVLALVIGGLLSMRGKWGAAVLARASAATRPSPEARTRVSADEVGIECSTPDGRVVRVGWKDIIEVRIRTTSGGPLMPDVFWEVRGAPGTAAVVYPNGAEGEDALLAALAARLPGFDHRRVGEAMGSTSDRTFTVWHKCTSK